MYDGQMAMNQIVLASALARLGGASGEPELKSFGENPRYTTYKTRDGKAVAFDAAKIKAGESLSITVAKGDEAKSDWTCSMHPEVAEAKPGKCPKCAMTLKERARPAKAAELKVQ